MRDVFSITRSRRIAYIKLEKFWSLRLNQFTDKGFEPQEPLFVEVRWVLLPKDNARHLRDRFGPGGDGFRERLQAPQLSDRALDMALSLFRTMPVYGTGLGDLQRSGLTPEDIGLVATVRLVAGAAAGDAETYSASASLPRPSKTWPWQAMVLRRALVCPWPL